MRNSPHSNRNRLSKIDLNQNVFNYKYRLRTVTRKKAVQKGKSYFRTKSNEKRFLFGPAGAFSISLYLIYIELATWNVLLFVINKKKIICCLHIAKKPLNHCYVNKNKKKLISIPLKLFSFTLVGISITHSHSFANVLC